MTVGIEYLKGVNSVFQSMEQRPLRILQPHFEIVTLQAAAAMFVLDGEVIGYQSTTDGRRHKGQIVYIEIVEPTRALKMQAHVGTRDPLRTTALRKAIPAHLDEPDKERILTQSLAERTRSLLE